MKFVNPYTRLLNEIREFCQLISRKPIVVETATLDKNSTYALLWIHQRIVAGKQLGYDTMIETRGDEIVVKFVQRLSTPNINFRWR